MEIVFGPVVRLRGAEDSPARWQVSVLVVTADAPAGPTLHWTGSGGAAGQADASRLATAGGRTVWRHLLDLPREASANTITYHLDTGRSWSLIVPALGERPRIAYTSCNGFSEPKIIKKVGDPYAMWRRMAEMHADAPYHVLLMGGDQVYADSLWGEIDELEEWSQDDSVIANVTRMSPEVQAKVDAYYFNLYLKRWARAEVADMLAAVPTLMMWDDHDIFDGWGSHAPARQGSLVFQAIFAAARRWFCVFQLHSDPEDPGPEFLLPQRGFTHARRLDDLAILVLDLRSERSSTQVMGRETWDTALKWIDAQEGLKHLLVMTSIPVCYADFEALGSFLGRVPGTQELEDDLRDHWNGRGHQGERLRLIHRLLDFAERRATRVTIVSGDVHVAALGQIESSRFGPARSSQTIYQLIASGIVHPPAPGIVVYAMEQLFQAGGQIDRGIELSMQPLPGSRRRMLPARNWLSLEPDPPGGRDRLWARWIVEGEEEAYVKVIHAVGPGGPV